MQGKTLMKVGLPKQRETELGGAGARTRDLQHRPEQTKEQHTEKPARPKGHTPPPWLAGVYDRGGLWDQG